MTSQPKSITTLITDGRQPLEMRIDMLRQVAHSEGDQAGEILSAVVTAATEGNGKANLDERLAELDELIQGMRNGPLRAALFLELTSQPEAPPRARVVLPDGSQAFCVVPDEGLAKQLRRGERVWLEAQAKALLFRDEGLEDIGDEARLERRLGLRVEVTLRNDERAMFHASQRLLDALDADEVQPGCPLVVCSGSRMALSAVPPEDGLSHLRYLNRGPVPDVVIERDIGSPPAYLEQFASHLRMELERPEVARRHRIPRYRTVLLTGVSGTGKTLSIQAWWRQMYAITAEHYGLGIDELPPRVLTLNPAQVLSQWLGVSDKNLDRFFEEVEELASRPWIDRRGRALELPVCVVIEEIDGVARQRGHDGIHDRIMTTLLRRLDPNGGSLKDKLLFVLGTTNVPDVVDTAFLRRIGGRTESFGRLGRQAFRAVFDKHLRGRPMRGAAAAVSDPARGVAAELEAWLFGRRDDEAGLVEVGYAGSNTPEVKHHKDFLTGSLVDRAVQQAAEESARAEYEHQGEPGLDARRLQLAFDAQVRSIVDQLRPENVHQHLTLPDGARPTTVRRLRPEALPPASLERAPA